MRLAHHSVPRKRLIHLKRVLKRLPLAKDWVSCATLIVAVVGGIIAIDTLRTNSKALRTNTRGQIYAEDRALYQREFDKQSSINSIYVEVTASPKESNNFISARLRLIAPIDTKNIYEKCDSAETLYNAIWGESSYLDSKKYNKHEQVAIRKVAVHVEEYFYHLAATFDYSKDDVISYSEWLTWRAWFKDVGLHPLLLMALYNALDNRYIGAHFATEVREALDINDAERQAFVEHFLGKEYGPKFIHGDFSFLSDYDYK